MAARSTLIILAVCHVAVSLPPRIDLGFIIDSTLTQKDFSTAIDFIEQFLKFVSISPGTTRTALYLVSSTIEEVFRFRTHVNRECVQKSLEQVTKKANEKSYEFQDLLLEVFGKLERQSRDVIEQRRIYVFLTNSLDEVIQFEARLKIKRSELDYFGAIIIGDDVTEWQGLQYIEPDDIFKTLKELNIQLIRYDVCKGDGNVFDECNRHCKCVNGKLTNCYRVRKEFTSMSVEERRRYLRAYKTLTTSEPYKGVYERYVFMHYKYFCWGIHNRELFLPWHRWFISVMENLLKQIDCRVTLTYWDWSYVSNDPWNRQGIWRSTDDGLGGNGNRFKGYCVQTGIFREAEWETPYWEDPMDIILSAVDQLDENIEDQYGHLAFCVRRSFKGKTPTRKSVQRTLAIPARRFKDFDIQMRHNYHDRLHNIIGGTMSTHYAGDTPEFFMHHSFLDKIWYTWQAKSKAHKYVHFLQRNKTSMLGCDYTPSQYIDAHALPRCIKVKYEPFPREERQTRSLQDDIDSMPRKSTQYWKHFLNESWYGSFPSCKRTAKERRRAKYLHKVLDAP